MHIFSTLHIFRILHILHILEGVQDTEDTEDMQDIVYARGLHILTWKQLTGVATGPLNRSIRR